MGFTINFNSHKIKEIGCEFGILPQMNISLSPQQIKNFSRLLQCMQRIGECLTISVNKSHMKLVCTNLNRSFYADFTIDRSYFDTYAIYTDENSNPTQNSASKSQNSLTFSLFTKIFAMVLRKLSFDKSVKKLKLSFDDSEELQDFFLL